MRLDLRGLSEDQRMVGTALIGALIGLVTYEIVYALNPITPRASSSWLIAFLINVARQHGLHRWLTFKHPTPYWSSLGRAYVMYSGSAVVGSLLNAWLTVGLAVHHRAAWAICLSVTAMMSFFLLKRFVFARSS